MKIQGSEFHQCQYLVPLAQMQMGIGYQDIKAEKKMLCYP